MDGQFRSIWDFIGILDVCLKIFKILYYGFTMLWLDLALSHTCISYISAKFLGKDLLVQCIFLSVRYVKWFRDLLKQGVTFDAIKKILRDQRSKTYGQMAEADLDGGAAGARPPPFFRNLLLFWDHFEELQTVLIKYRWSLIMHLWPTFTQTFTQYYQNIFNTQSFVAWQTVIMLF